MKVPAKELFILIIKKVQSYAFVRDSPSHLSKPQGYI